MSKIRLSSVQLAVLYIGFIYGSTSILNPTAAAMQDAWLSYLIGWIWGFFLIGIYVSIYLLNPSMSLIGILKTNFGRFLGTAIGIFYLWYFLHIAALVIRNFGEFVSLVTLPNTPMPFITGCLMLLSAYSLKKGLEVSARTTELLIPLVPIASGIITIGVIRLFSIENILPVLANGMKPVLQASFGLLTFPFGETIAFMAVFPYLNKKSSIKKPVFIGVLLAGLILFSVVLRDGFALGPDLTRRAAFPTELASKLIPNINIYPVVLVNLLLGGAVKASVCIFAVSSGIVEITGMSDYKALILPISAFTVVLSLWLFGNIIEMFTFTKNVWPYYSIPFQIIIPLLLLVISLIKKAAKKKKAA